jgi:hypothetical protein
MAIRPGTLNNFGGSMAQAIEESLRATLIADGLPDLPMDDTLERRDRRRLFVAIARGVVSHLQSNHTSMAVPYVDDGVNKTTSVTLSVTWS